MKCSASVSGEHAVAAGADGAEAPVAACGARHEGAGERAACLRARLAGERKPAGGRSRQRIWRGVLATCQRRRRWGRGVESDEIAPAWAALDAVSAGAPPRGRDAAERGERGA